MRPIKRIYINFDKDISPKMFGFRVRFVKDKMNSYNGRGVPQNSEDQSHKPIVQYTKEKIQGLLNRYDRVDDYFSK